MNKAHLIQTIQTELKRLNQEIDLKILKGLPYRKEARRHKFLISELRNLLRARQGMGWFQKTAQMVTMLMF